MSEIKQGFSQPSSGHEPRDENRTDVPEDMAARPMQSDRQCETNEDSGPLQPLQVFVDEAGQRLDRFLALKLHGVSRTRIKALIKTGMVRRAGRKIEEPGARVKSGERYHVEMPPPEAAIPLAEAIEINVVYEDQHLIVVDKPAGLVVHPAAGHPSGTLVNALLAHCAGSLSGIGGIKRPGIVHRLDKDTSGLMVAAKTDAAHQGLSAQFEAHGADGRLTRRYLALVWGIPERPCGIIDAPLARSAANRTKIAVVRAGQGRRAVTTHKTIKGFVGSGGRPVGALLQCELETGRTHQIRVHMAHKGHPIMGDAVYGAGFAASARNLADGARGALAALARQALHAAHLGFVHPITGDELAFETDPPADMTLLLHELGRR